MADGNTTKLIIELEVLLRNLNRTLQGLDQVKKRLTALSAIKVGATQARTTNQSAIAAQRLALAQQRLQLQQQRLQLQQQGLVVGTRNLANAQGRATLASQRLALGQQRLAQAQQRLVTANTAAGKSAISLDQTLGRVGGSLRNLGLGLTSLGSSLTVALSAPLAALGVLSTQNAVTLDSLNRGLIAIVGSADEAGRQLARLTQIAKLPGIGFQEAIQGSIRLQAVGFSAQVAERALIQFSNAVALTGGGREELARITVQLGQLSAKGKVLAQDLKPIIEAGPAVGRALLEAFGTVNSEDIQALGLSSREFIDQLLTQLEKLPRAAAGLRNTFDNFADAVFRASAAIGGAILPVLTRLIETAEPITLRLVEAFKQLSPPLQTLIVLFGALTTAVGPALFIFGQFATGIGGLISAFGRLHALGLLPTIASFRLLGQVMTGTASLVAGQAATTAAAAAGWGALGVAILGVVALAGGIALLLNQQKSAIKISKEQIAETETQIATIKDQLKFVDELNQSVERTADEQERLTEIYTSLNTQARIRLTAISDEEKRLGALREELQQLLRLRNEERIQQAANLAASLAATNAQIEAELRSRDSIARRVIANTQLAESIQKSGKVTVEQSRQLERLGLSGAATAEQAIFDLNRANERLIDNQTDLINSSKELNGTAQEQGQALKVLSQQTGLSARELLSAAKAMGLFKGNIEEALPAIERFIADQERAATATDAFTETLRRQNEELIKAGNAAEQLQKQRKDRIDAAVALAKEASSDFQGALKFLRAFAAAQPELRAAIDKERQLAGKSFEEFIEDALGGDPGAKGKTTLRNAQQQLANSLQDVTEASAAKRLATEKASNDALIEANETAQRLQLISYRQYLQAREVLTNKNLDLEITATRLAATNARESQIRLLDAARKAGIPEAERVRRLAQAAEEEEKAIKAETELIELEAERGRNAAELKRELGELAIQQLKDVRQLEIEFAELGGRIEDALNTATDERFREALTDLARTQDFLNRQLERATKARNSDLIAETTSAIQLNQRQIDAINNIINQERALNRLAAANEFVRQAKERQAELERQLAFEVEFRGLKEEDAIARRLEGERKLADSLRVVRDLIQSAVVALQAQGVEPPRALIEFIRDIKGEIDGLGELSFSEQFRLIEKEFNRLNDERLRRIADVERAVRTRTLAEAEGLLLIRRINGEYAGDLERQVELLRQVAEASGDADLQRSAEDAAQTTKDANEQLADFNKQLRATSIDALRDGFTEFFQSLGDRTRTAREKLLDLVNSVAARINEVIAENLSRKLIESIFGDGSETGDGIIASVRRVFGGGKQTAQHEAGVAVDTAAAATTALQTGTAAATAAFTTGVTTAGATFGTTVLTTAASFASTIIAAGAAFAAAIGVSSAADTGAMFARFIGGGESGLFPAVPGGVYKFVEGGYPEAVLTTDPRHATKQAAILRAYLKETRGLYGRIKGFAAGGFISPSQIDSSLLSGMSHPSVPTSDVGSFAVVGAPSMMKLRQVLVDQRNYRDWLTSSEGEEVVVDILYRNQPVIRKLGGKK